MRIVAIDASERRGVVTLSVEAAARAAEEAGATVERVRLADIDIRFCTGCAMCRVTGRCKIDDDLPALADIQKDEIRLKLVNRVERAGTVRHFTEAFDPADAGEEIPNLPSRQRLIVGHERGDCAHTETSSAATGNRTVTENPRDGRASTIISARLP